VKTRSAKTNSAKAKSAKKKSAKKKASRRSVISPRAANRRTISAKPSRKRINPDETSTPRFSTAEPVPALSGDSDSQGLSEVERADSESIAELVDEGNIFEAGAVSGVQHADDADEKEVRIRELPEDDVPEEYDDQD